MLHHTLPKAVAAGLVIVSLIGTLQACQRDGGQYTQAENEMDARHDEDSGDGIVHWSYEGTTGPGQWGSLDSSFAVCDTGIQQSPIDLAGAASGSGSELAIQWQPTDAQVIDNGHTIQVDIDE